MAVISVGLSCFDQFFFLNRWPERIPKISPAILLKAAADLCQCGMVTGIVGEIFILPDT